MGTILVAFYFGGFGAVLCAARKTREKLQDNIVRLSGGISGCLNCSCFGFIFHVK
jgi:amino acid transporter